MTNTPNTQTEAPLAEWHNERLHPARLLNMARMNAGFEVQELAVVLNVSRNAISDMQRPGKIKTFDLVKILKWCLACEVRPSFISKEYEMHDVAVEAKLLDLRARGVTFAEELIGYDPRKDEQPPEDNDIDLIQEDLPAWLRVKRGSDGDMTAWLLGSVPFRPEVHDGDNYDPDGIASAFGPGSEDHRN